MAADIKTRYNLDVSTNSKARYKLLKEAERVKTVLSANTEVRWGIEFFMNDTDVKGTLDRATVDTLAQGLYTRVGTLLTRCLANAGVAAADLHSIEIVGGNVRVPGTHASLSLSFSFYCRAIRVYRGGY